MIDIVIKNEEKDDKVYVVKTNRCRNIKIAMIILAFYALHKRLAYNEDEIAKLKKIVEELKPKKGA